MYGGKAGIKKGRGKAEIERCSCSMKDVCRLILSALNVDFVTESDAHFAWPESERPASRGGLSVLEASNLPSDVSVRSMLPVGPMQSRGTGKAENPRLG
jgi:hypothetical protein